MDFESFGKIGRMSRAMIVTEKIDGTNGQIALDDDLNMYVGSRNRWITPEDDNYGFARWCKANEEELRKLGPGRHYGEWWGQGIQRGYGLKEKRFSLFNAGRWNEENKPACCHVVPILFHGQFDSKTIDDIISALSSDGSMASLGFMEPEGIIVYHVATKTYFKKTIKKDDEPKGKFA